MTKLKYLLFLLLFILSCKSQDINQITTFNLKELPKITEVTLSDLGFVDIEYIPLETNEVCTIRMINNIIFGKNYLLTHFFTNVYMFRYDGKFVAKIGKEGRGPNEFTVVHDVDIDIKNQNIYLVDGWQKKFYVFSGTGTFNRTFKTPLYAGLEFRFTADGILCYNMNQFANVENSFCLIDTTGRIIKNFPNKYPWHLAKGAGTYVYQFENIFYRFDNQLFKKEVYSDTIYLFEKMDFKPHIVIEQGKRLINTTARSEFSPEQIRNSFITPMNLFEFGDYIYYEFVISLNSQGKLVSYIGSKINNFKALFDPEKGILNDLDGGPNIWPKGIKDDNTIIGWIDALQLKAHVATEAFKNSKPKYPEMKKELEKLANSLKETDNPVLMIVKLKN